MSINPKIVKFNGWQTVVCKEAAVAPYFSSMLRHRIHKKLACNVVVTGEPRLGKSYQAIDIARVFEGLTETGHDRFKPAQVVYYFSQFMELTLRLPIGKAIVFDEPSYAMGKREWYKDLNKALVLTIESKGFKVHPLFIPIINKALLDKIIRSYLIQFQVEMRDRGKADVYRISPSQANEKVYRIHLCSLDYRLFDSHLCKKDSCLGCDTLPTCMVFRAQYERSKAKIQDERYEQQAEQANTRESLEMTDQQIADLLYPLKDLMINDKGHLDQSLLHVVAFKKLQVKIGHNRAYRIKKLLQFDHPADFE